MTQIGAVLPVAPQVSKPAEIAENAVETTESFDSLLTKAQTEKAADPSSSLGDEAKPQIKDEKDGKKEQADPLFRAEQMIAEPIVVALQLDSSVAETAQTVQQEVPDESVCAVNEISELPQITQMQSAHDVVTENKPINIGDENSGENDFISQVKLQENQDVQPKAEVDSTVVVSEQGAEVVKLEDAEVAVGSKSEIQSQAVSQNQSVENPVTKTQSNQSGEISGSKAAQVDLSQVKVVESNSQNEASFNTDAETNGQTEIVQETVSTKAQVKDETAQSVEGQSEVLQAQKSEPAVGKQSKAEQGSDTEAVADEGGYSEVRVVNAYSQGNVVIEVSKEPEQVQQASVYNQITSTVRANLEEGRKEFVMELNPESLGKVLVKLVSEGGKLTVELAAYNPKTQSLLMEGSEEIRNILQANEQRPVVVEENQNPQWYEQNSSNQNARQQGESQGEQQGRQKENHEFTTKDFVSFMQLMKVSV